MSLFSFVKSAGRLLGIGHAEAATQDETKTAPPTPDAPTIQAELTRLGLPGDAKVAVEGDKVTLSGAAPDPETREKLVLAAGNVAGVAHVEENLATPAPAPEPVFHTVVHGDTLSAIAQKTLGNASHYPKIFEANRPMLTDPNKIYPGQVLRIPQG